MWYISVYVYDKDIQKITREKILKIIMMVMKVHSACYLTLWCRKREWTLAYWINQCRY